jgi:hypothetical protein
LKDERTTARGVLHPSSPQGTANRSGKTLFLPDAYDEGVDLCQQRLVIAQINSP